MQNNSHLINKKIVTGSLFIMSVFCLCLGLALCLTKSPDSQSDYYLALSQQYQAQLNVAVLQSESEQYLLERSHDMVVRSIYEAPYNPQSWYDLAVTLAQLDKVDKAMQARDIASSLGANTLPTITALRSLLPAQNVALSKTSNNNMIVR